MPSDLTLEESKKALKATMLELMKKKFQLVNIPCNKPDALEAKRSVESYED